ncbi:MAG: tetratricopeptide repeat protein [Gammaproteobacteria bacterium]
MQLRTLIISLCLILAACSNPEKAWELADREDTNQGYLEFLAKYPDGKYADQARERMIELKELRGWERAQFRDKIENYRRFVAEHPDSENAPAARQRINELERDAAWAAAESSNDAVALQGFLASYPEAPQTGEAQQLLAALAPPIPEPPPEPLGNFRVQVGAFRTAKAADNEVRRLTKLLDSRVVGTVKIVTPQESGSRFFLLHSQPLTGPAAATVCKELQQRNQACLVINR